MTALGVPGGLGRVLAWVVKLPPGMGGGLLGPTYLIIIIISCLVLSSGFVTPRLISLYLPCLNLTFLVWFRLVVGHIKAWYGLESLTHHLVSSLILRPL